ncbi:hypothetical protein [Georgenia thermotolerans]|uniref:DUF4386 family protein n=1 Tax=Georgenia thermotolerans TaxID=527326 RepID=A0A7J5UL85_9MICO|nr:hypothetical protein [Georgenia thermotolerans]KAE8763125.1 hypothetical protein GB883_15805 [Georgenia thermotolerans]
MSRRGTAVALLTAPLAGLAGTVLLPASADAGAQLVLIQAQPARWLGANVLLVVSFLCFAGALLGLTGLFRARGSRLGVLAAVVAALGWALHVGPVAYVLAQYPLAHQPDRAGATEIAAAMFAAPSFVVLIVPVLLATVAGTLALAVALWRTRLAPRWAAATLVAALAADFAAPDAVSGVVMFALTCVALAPLAARLLAPETPVAAGVAARV